jgi:hypothetical protein
MTENDARHALLIRAFETAPAAPPWDDADREWATRSAAQIEGENASADAFVSRRAGLAAERLSKRVPAVAQTLSALRWRPWVGVTAVLAALLAGVILDAVSADQQINVLAPPILAILIWNLGIFALLAGRLVWRKTAAPGAATPSWPVRLIARIAGGTSSLRRPPRRRTPLAAFAAHWALASAPLGAARAGAVLHAAAAAFAAGALGGLYLRGLAFEYRAGWESTFLDVTSVQVLLQTVLGPASLLTGIALPDEARLAAIRLPGGTAENAAGWIHLYAVTVIGAVVLPRIALAALDAWRARRLATTFPIQLTDGYFQDLCRRHRGAAAVVHVRPYSFLPPVETIQGLNRLMQHVYGPATIVSVSPPVPLGGEDHLQWSGRTGTAATPGMLTVALFSLSATPEVENHAAFMTALARALPADSPLVALVDETAFRNRFGDESTRLETRRAAWRKILASGIDVAPVFAALGKEDIDGVKRQLTEVLHEISGRMVQNPGYTADAKASA